METMYPPRIQPERHEASPTEGAEQLPIDPELEARIELLRELILRQLGANALRGDGRIPPELRDPKQADPGVLGDATFDVIIRGGM